MKSSMEKTLFQQVKELAGETDSPDFESRKAQCLEKLLPAVKGVPGGQAASATLKRLFKENQIDTAYNYLESIKKTFYPQLILPIFFGLIGLFLTIYGSYILIIAYDSLSWPETTGVVIASEVQKHTFTRRTSRGNYSTNTYWSAHITYRYSVDGKSYESDRFSYAEKHEADKMAAARKIAEYPLGREVNVYYKPSKPGTSILAKGTFWFNAIILFIGAPFLVVGIFVFFIRVLPYRHLIK